MTKTPTAFACSQKLLSGLAGLAIGATLWAALSLAASVADEMLYDLNERCYHESLGQVIEHSGEGPATGCIPASLFVVLAAARYGPAVFLLPSLDVAHRASLLSALVFAVIGGLSFALVGRRSGIRLTVVAIGLLELALIAFLLVLWKAS